ncbi:MAG TPA: hypothetical protein VNU97_10695 [Rhizomicrobium sp.]|jgi:hypothetical protein|nr:hypothetical protein [Rhizomicrobium sp.]
MKRFSTMLAACAAFAVPAAAGPSAFDAVFAKVDGGKPCYVRLYDAAHLKAHPHQSVRGIAVDFDPLTEDGKPAKPANFQLDFSFQLKGRTPWYGDGAYCHAAAGAFDCYLDADGGLFHLTPQGDGLKLDIVPRGGRDAASDQINVEGEDGFYGFGKPSGDDHSFLLSRAPHRACEAQ